MDYEGDNQQMIYPHALVIVPGRMSLDEGRRLGYLDDDEAAPGIGPEELDEGLSVDDGDQLEGIAINELMTDHPCDNDDAESMSFEKFVSEMQLGWQVQRVHRAGVFAAANYVTDEDLVRTVMGSEGDNSVIFTGHATPSHAAAWEGLLLGVNAFLSANEPWRAGLTSWLEAHEARPAAEDCRVQIYHLFDIVRGLLGLATNRGSCWIYQLGAIAGPDDAPTRRLIGSLVWDGSGTDPLTAVETIVDGGVEGYVFTTRSTFQDESRLLAAMGLHHVLLSRDGDVVEPWRAGDAEDIGEARMLDDYVNTHMDALADLRTRIEERAFGFFGPST